MTKFVKDDKDNYVDNGLNVVVEEGTHFNDAAIIPTVQYQVFGLDNVWFWDNEGQNYTFDKSTVSTINVKVITGQTRTYQKVGELSFTTTTATTGGTSVAKFDTVPENAKVGDLFYTLENSEDPTSNRTYRVITASFENPATEVTTGGTEISNFTSGVPAGAVADDLYYTVQDTYAADSITAPYEFNKYGKEETGVEVLVTLTPNSDLKTSYPGAIITINGKEYDINHTSFKLYMDKDYRISINWVWGSVVETFRIICNR
jgi:hypothetical protein